MSKKNDMWAPEPLVETCILAKDQYKGIERALIDTGATGYAFVDESFAHSLIQENEAIVAARLPRPKEVLAFDGDERQAITHFLPLSFSVQGRKVYSAPFLITRLGQHKIILGLPWMIQQNVLISPKDRRIAYAPEGYILPRGEGNWTDQLKEQIQYLERSTRSPLPKIEQRKSQPSVNAKPATATKKDCVDDDNDNDGVTQSSKTPLAVNAPPAEPPRPTKILKRGQTIEESVPAESAHVDQSGRTSGKARYQLVGAPAFSLEAQRRGNTHGVTSYEEVCALAAISEDEEPCQISGIGLPLTQEQIRKDLPEWVRDYTALFDRQKANELPEHKEYDHKIELTAPIEGLRQERLRRTTQEEAIEIKKYLEENLRKEFIKPSKASYASPILFVRKKDGTLRFCVDYRRLNAITKRNRYPLPLIDQVMAQVSGCKYFTKLDIISAFNKIRMDPTSEEASSFLTQFGMYCYQVLPFGLTNGPASWQRYINEVLFEYLDKFCQAYVDDILIYSRARKEHHQHVRMVLEKLNQAGLQVDLKKCEWEVSETKFLGMMIDGNGIRMDPEKVKAIINWPIPRNLKQVQAFLGFCNFYRRFIRDFGKISRPLHQLSRKNKPFQWDEECQRAFERLKEKITTAPVLRHYDPSRTAYVEADSSDKVIGGLLSQKDDDGHLHPVAFFSKNLDPAQCNYDIYDKELLAIIKAFESWEVELKGTDLPIQVLTDHRNLEYFRESRKLTPRQVRWLERLSQFNFVITYRPGKQNLKADALTRQVEDLPISTQKEREEYQNRALLPAERFLVSEMDTQMDRPGEAIYERVRIANQEDPTLKSYREHQQKGHTYTDGVDLSRSSIHKGVLYQRGRLWVPESFQVLVIRATHEPKTMGHAGIKKTLELLNRYYFWPGMRPMVQQFIRNCHICRMTKASHERQHGLLKQLPIPQERWVDLAMDFVVRLPESDGYNTILTVVDRLSNAKEFIPMRAGKDGASAEETAKAFLQHVYSEHGLPDSIVSDRGRQFVSTFWKAFCNRLGIERRLSSSYHPETDGQSERANQELETVLRAYVNHHQDNWAELLPIVKFALNNTVTASTNMTPFFLNKGFHPRTNLSPNPTEGKTSKERKDIRRAEDISKNMETLLQEVIKYKEAYKRSVEERVNQHRKDVTYNVGDLVWVNTENIPTDRPSKKLDYKNIGPCRITEKVGHSYRVELPHGMRHDNVFHPKLLRLDQNDPLPGQTLPPPKPIWVEGEEEHGVDEIRDARRLEGKLQYKVTWTGYNPTQTWWDANDGEFDRAKEAVDAFYRRYPRAAGGPAEDPNWVDGVKRRGRPRKGAH